MASAILAMILSFFVPGLGQFYCGSLLRGICVFLAVSIVGLAAGAISFLLALTLIVPLIMTLVCLLVWVWNIYDAYTLAMRTAAY
jgi:hypothetical protein